MPDLPANATTTAILNFDEDVRGVLDYAGDRDWYRIEVGAGDWVEVTQRAVRGDPLEDALVRVYDANGKLITADDESSASNTDFNAGVMFGGDVGGTYYIEAGSYRDNYAGDYALNAQVVAAPSGSPVDALDSGTQRTDSNISVHFVEAGERANFSYTTSDTQDNIRSEGWSAYEKQRFEAALDTIAAVTDLTFTITSNENADFQLILDTNELNNNGLLGYFYLPSGTRASVGVFNGNGLGWDDFSGGGLETGGLGYATIVHEVLHGLGLTHPHDSSAAIGGVDTPFGDLGVNGLNQGIFTTMSYNGGYATQPTYSNSSGNEAGPMGLDVAALQDLYGSNTTTASGNDIYVIPDTGGTLAWQAIWDVGGTDHMQYTGSRDTTIDLRAATLTHQVGGAGFVSYADGITGGFTIANGVVIENATGGTGDDRLVGNAAANVLTGGNGSDTMDGGSGDDTLNGGAGNDVIFGAAGNDAIDGGTGNDAVSGGSEDDIISGGEGNDILSGDSGSDQITAVSGLNTINGNGGSDILTGGTGIDVIDGGSGDDVIDGGLAGDVLFGGRGQDTIDGGDGDDDIEGGLGADILTGGLGEDTFIFQFVTDSAPGVSFRDEITDFVSGDDVIDLNLIDADRDVAGDQAFDFIGTDSFSAAGQIRLEVIGADSVVEVDRDGDGMADMEILLTGVTGLTISDFIL